jgi:hypothetical protein
MSSELAGLEEDVKGYRIQVRGHILSPSPSISLHLPPSSCSFILLLHLACVINVRFLF